MIPRTRWAVTSRGSATGSSSKLVQVLRFGCSYASIADCTSCRPPGAATVDRGRDLGQLDVARGPMPVVGLVLGPGRRRSIAGPRRRGRWPQPRRRGAGHGGRSWWGRYPARPRARPRAGTSPRSWPPRWTARDIGPLPDGITVHLVAGYVSQRPASSSPAAASPGSPIGRQAPIQAGQRWHVVAPRLAHLLPASSAASSPRSSSSHSSISPSHSSPSVVSSARHGLSIGV